MGNHSSKHRKDSLEGCDLQIGDVVLFREKNGGQPYITRCFGWTGYSFAAFVVSMEGSSPLLCGHFPSGTKQVRHALEAMTFGDAIRTGKYDAIYVRQLCHPLDEGHAAKVDQFARHMLKQGRDAKLDTVSVMMSMPSPVLSIPDYFCMKSHVDRFMTSRLIADMLMAVGYVRRSGKNSYVADTSTETVLRQAVPVTFEQGHAETNSLS